MMLRLLSTVLLLWALGFALFASTLPHPADDRVTDGIVVLTGGPGRVQRGVALLQAGKARRMLVSGVDRQVRPAELATINRFPHALLSRIDLGAEAVDTRSNADEAAAWIASYRFHTIRVVTTDWHMRRARLELAQQLPRDVTLLPDAIPSTPNLVALLREYNKYLLRRAATLIGR
ncbi:YdcF family protein [Sphingomonas sp. BIUV-7]|uniref:YdcF family protein n=1 Tax=Sphingomonas natans TaxID=3063330 RepID=A0ABT8YDA0_9SPHN|nr:YdcF family protein [Sphingomonas sp. BIUV-7]MDO6416317.1 YdcF family protein [Sphingomonas sp. BIUV-7]